MMPQPAKAWLPPLGLLVALVSALALGPARAQGFTLDSQSVTAAPQPSAAGLFSLLGNLRQIDPEQTLSGGGFSLQGGFTPVPAPHSEAVSPEIVAIMASGRVEVRWSAAGAEGFALEQSAELGPSATWTRVSAVPTVVDGENVLAMEATGDTRFFRLRRP